jgi:predicted DNA-binding transcriptional regulator YafY
MRHIVPIFLFVREFEMAQNDRVIRLIRMVLLIEAHPGLTVEELAKQNGISIRHCYRDIQALCYAGVPLYCDDGYRLIEKSGLKKLSLTLEEALALIYGIKLLEKQQGPIRAGTELKEKLFDLLPNQLRNEIEDLQKQVEVSANTAVDYSKSSGLFKRLNEAIREQQSLNMEYYSFTSGELKTRTADPYQIVYRDGFWYLVAFCHLRNEIRLFRVDRIRKLELTLESFVKPPDFDLESYLGSAWQMERGEEFVFQVRLGGSAARYARETRFHPSQEIREMADGSLILTAKACGLKSVTRWVLQFGGEAEVLEPVELREMVAGEARKMCERYGKGEV